MAPDSFGSNLPQRLRCETISKNLFYQRLRKMTTRLQSNNLTMWYNLIVIMDDDSNTFLIDNDPAKLLPFTRRLLPEDPEAAELARHFMRNTYPEQNDDMTKLRP